MTTLDQLAEKIDRVVCDVERLLSRETAAAAVAASEPRSEGEAAAHAAGLQGTSMEAR